LLILFEYPSLLRTFESGSSFYILGGETKTIRT